MNELEKARKIFGDFKNEEALNKAYRSLVKMYSENAEDEEKFKEVNVARNTALKYLKKYKSDKKRLEILYNKKSVYLKEEEDYLEEYAQKIKAVQEVIKSLKKSSRTYMAYKKIPTVVMGILFAISIITLIMKPDFLFIFTLLYAFFFSVAIKAAKQKEKLSAIIKQRKLLRTEMQQIEKKVQGMKIELRAVEIALELCNSKSVTNRTTKRKLIEKSA